MDIPFNHLNYIDMWTKPIDKYHISPDIKETIELMALEIMTAHLDELAIITKNIINYECRKHSANNMLKQLLIKNQIIYNFTENIKTLTINIAKEKYDIEQERIIDENKIPINFYDDIYNNQSLILYDNISNETIDYYFLN